jgi:hypothetical protein
MIWLRKRLWWAAIVVPLGFAVAGCDDGPMEETGEAVDETAEEAGEAAEDATD